MNPEEFSNLLQLYNLNSAQQAINKQNQDENLSEITRSSNLTDSIILNIFNKSNLSSNFTELLKKNNFFNFLFNSKPIASCVVSSSTSVSSDALISTSTDLLASAQQRNENFEQILVRNEFNSDQVQSKMMLKRKFTENYKDADADQFNERSMKKLCQQNDQIDETKDYPKCANSLHSDSINNINIKTKNQYYDNQKIDNNESIINDDIFATNLQKNNLEENKKVNFDVEPSIQFKFTGNLIDDLPEKCSVDLFPPNLQLPHLQNSDEKHIQAEILKNIKNYESYLDFNKDQCQIKKLRDHFHCNYESYIEKSLTRRDETVRHIKLHKKRLESLKHGFLRFSSTDDCTQFYMQQQLYSRMQVDENSKESKWPLQCQYNRKQTHYHCMQPNCDKIYISTSDVQMHSKYHRKDIQLSLEGFQRFRANEKCNKDYCIFNKQHTTHFHCRRENCKFTFKNKSDVEKHKTYHNKDFELLKDGFKKFLKNDQCNYKKCRFSKVCNHIHCMRQDCNYVLHSSGQLLSHKRRHDRLDAEKGYQPYNTLQRLQIEKQNDVDLNENTVATEFPIDLSLFNFNNMGENISGIQSSLNSHQIHKTSSSNLKIATSNNNIDSKYLIDKSESNHNLILNENKSIYLENLKMFEEFSMGNDNTPNFLKNNTSTKRLEENKNLVSSSMLNSFIINNSNITTKNNEKCNFRKFRLKSNSTTNLQSLDINEMGLLINKYFTISSLSNIITNVHLNTTNMVEYKYNQRKANADVDNGENYEDEDLSVEDHTYIKSKQNSINSNQKYFHCKVINCNKIIKENLSEILDHIEFHERVTDKLDNFVASESSGDLFNLSLAADSSTVEQNSLIVQNTNLKETYPTTEHSMQITSIDGLFNRKRGRPPKNRFVEVYLNNEKHQSPQAVFTSFKLAKCKEKSSLESESDQLKNINLMSTKRPMLDSIEDEIVVNVSTTIENSAEELDKNMSDDDYTIGKTVKAQLSNAAEIQYVEDEISASNEIVELKHSKENLPIEKNIIFEDDENFPAKEKIVRAVRTFFPQNSIIINSEDISAHSNSISFRQCIKKTCKLKKKFQCNLCDLSFEDIEELKSHKCIKSISNSTKQDFYRTINDLKPKFDPTIQKSNDEKHTTEEPEDLSLNRVPAETKYEETQNRSDEYFSPLLHNLHLTQKLALLQQQFFPYLAAQKAIQKKDSADFFKNQFEQHCFFAMTAAISKSINLNPSPNLNSNFPDIFPVLQPTAVTDVLDLNKKNGLIKLKKKNKNHSKFPDNFSEEPFNQVGNQNNCNFKILKDEAVPTGYLRYRFNEDCQFSNCSYRNHQTHFHCMRIDCYYSFCDKTRFVQHTARHERLDKLMGDDFKQYRANTKCNYNDCAYYKKSVNQIKKSSHFHCLKCNFICSDTNKVVAHRRQHNKTELIELAGFRKISNNEKCYIKMQNELILQNKNELPNIICAEECSYSLKQTHYHCTICDYAVLSRVQFNTHKHKNTSPNPGMMSPSFKKN